MSLSTPGGTLRMSFEAVTPRLVRVFGPARMNGTKSEVNLVSDDPPLVRFGVRAVLSHRKLTLEHPFWRIVAESTKGYPHPSVLRMNVFFTPTYAVDEDQIAPHGLVGQTFDRSHCVINGRHETYAPPPGNRTYVTRSQGEGGIEGKASDYMVATQFSTQFAYQRFSSVARLPRNISQLLGGSRCRPHLSWRKLTAAGQMVPGLNFQGFDLAVISRRKAPTAATCGAVCKEWRPRGCRAFTFVVTYAKSHNACFLKRDGYEKGALVSAGCKSGVVD